MLGPGYMCVCVCVCVCVFVFVFFFVLFSVSAFFLCFLGPRGGSVGIRVSGSSVVGHQEWVPDIHCFMAERLGALKDVCFGGRAFRKQYLGLYGKQRSGPAFLGRNSKLQQWNRKENEVSGCLHCLALLALLPSWLAKHPLSMYACVYVQRNQGTREGERQRGRVHTHTHTHTHSPSHTLPPTPPPPRRFASSVDRSSCPGHVAVPCWGFMLLRVLDLGVGRVLGWSGFRGCVPPSPPYAPSSSR